MMATCRDVHVHVCAAIFFKKKTLFLHGYIGKEIPFWSAESLPVVSSSVRPSLMLSLTLSLAPSVLGDEEPNSIVTVVAVVVLISVIAVILVTVCVTVFLLWKMKKSKTSLSSYIFYKMMFLVCTFSLSTLICVKVFVACNSWCSMMLDILFKLRIGALRSMF